MILSHVKASAARKPWRVNQPSYDQFLPPKKTRQLSLANKGTPHHTAVRALHHRHVLLARAHTNLHKKSINRCRRCGVEKHTRLPLRFPSHELLPRHPHGVARQLLSASPRDDEPGYRIDPLARREVLAKWLIVGDGGPRHARVVPGTKCVLYGLTRRHLFSCFFG